MSDNDLTYDEWAAKIKGADFETASRMIKEKMKLEISPGDHRFLDDTYEYFLAHYKSGEPVKMDNYKAHMTGVKGHADFGGTQFATFIVLMAVCGFSMTDFS